MITTDALKIAVLTLSDSRTLEQDRSGSYLCESLQEAGHQLADRRLIPDDIYQMRAVVSQWIADPQVQVILTTGGTGVTGRDSTPEAIMPLLDKQIEGFGELFRLISYEELGSSALHSRALAGQANATLIFCIPGSTGACRTAWTKILQPQLDITTKPCNFATMLPRFKEGL
ncbi:MAG: molybdenum cofactor biosynthesis protein B [Gammaproteobacteria bacterium]|nr:molybdenum cofactor biosynthesis protein B [Gammaproteobacteria bacterium]